MFAVLTGGGVCSSQNTAGTSRIDFARGGSRPMAVWATARVHVEPRLVP